MNETQLVLPKVTGLVTYNDGSFAEVELGGVEGIQKGLFLATTQLHVEDTQMSAEEFLLKFPVGMTMMIRTVRMITLTGLVEIED